MAIQPASWRELGSIRELERLCFPQDAWPLLDMIGVLTLPNVIRLRVLEGEKLLGFIAAEIRGRQKLAWIATICVHPEYQRRGIGAMLLQACQDRLDVPLVRLTVRSSNQAAIRLYKNFGYAPVDTWPRYYKGGEDATVMEKRLG